MSNWLHIIENDVDGIFAAPTLITDGVPLWKNAKGQKYQQGFATNVDEIDIQIKAHRTGGVALVLPAPRVWLWMYIHSIWVPIGNGTAANKGKLNGGLALEETTATFVVHGERVRGIREYTRIAVEQAALTAGATDDYDVMAVARGGLSPT